MSLVCGKAPTLTTVCDTLSFTVNGSELVASTEVIAYMTPDSSDMMSPFVVRYPTECRSPIIQFSGNINVVTEPPEQRPTLTETGTIPVPIAEYWCHPPGYTGEYFTGPACLQALPQGTLVGFRLRAADGYAVVPQQCTWSLPSYLKPVAAVDVLINACPTYHGVAEVFTNPADGVTWIALLSQAPVDAYTHLFDNDPTTHGQLLLHLQCSYAVIPEDLAASFMCSAGGSGGGRRLLTAMAQRRLQEQTPPLTASVNSISADIPMFGGSSFTPAPEPVPEPVPEPWFPSETVLIVAIFTFGVSAVSVAKNCTCGRKTPLQPTQPASPRGEANAAREARVARTNV